MRDDPIGEAVSLLRRLIENPGFFNGEYFTTGVLGQKARYVLYIIVASRKLLPDYLKRVEAVLKEQGKPLDIYPQCFNEETVRQVVARGFTAVLEQSFVELMLSRQALTEIQEKLLAVDREATESDGEESRVAEAWYKPLELRYDPPDP